MSEETKTAIADQALMEEIMALSASRKEENERLTEQVLAYKVQMDSKNRYIDLLQKSAIMSSIVTEYLRSWLQIFESKFESEKPEVTEASDYLTHAKWMKEHTGREDYGMIRRVQEWYDNQPAWKQKPSFCTCTLSAFNSIRFSRTNL